MSNYTILLIDYNPRSITSIQTLLERADYRVVVARDGVAGIKAFDETKPDLTLIEAMLPKKHGFDVCVELKGTEHGKKTPVIIVTGVYKGQRYRSQARHQLGCDRYLEKPLGDDVLLGVVQSFLPALPEPAPDIDRKPAPRPAPAAVQPVSLREEPALPALVEAQPMDPAESEIVASLDSLFPEPTTAATFVDPERKPDPF